MHSRERDETPLDDEPPRAREATIRLVTCGVAAASLGFAWLVHRVSAGGDARIASDVVIAALLVLGGLGLVIAAHVAAERERREAAVRIVEIAKANRTLHEHRVRKDEFLASVSHELRTPLNVVLGYVDLLLDDSFGALEPAQRDILHRITKNASNLSHLINDLVDLSRIEANRLRVEMETVEIGPLFADLRSVMEVLLAGREVAFRASIAPGCERVHADPGRLKQIVSNLLVNAVKFTERGAIELTAAPEVGGRVELAVTDTGIGIPPTHHQAIFEPFRQVHDRARRAMGAGIGLSIASRLAMLMNGALHVDSAPGRGSRFALVLEPAPAAATEPAEFRKVS